jgi:hypothetical protein
MIAVVQMSNIDLPSVPDPFLVPGIYRVQAELPDFKVASRTGVVLEVGAVMRIDAAHLPQRPARTSSRDLFRATAPEWSAARKVSAMFPVQSVNHDAGPAPPQVTSRTGHSTGLLFREDASAPRRSPFLGEPFLKGVN